MSEKTTPTAVPTEQPKLEVPDSIMETVEKKPNPIVRIARKVKSTPPKTAIAVAGGVALVLVGAALGRNTASHHIAIVESDFEPEPLIVTGEVEESTDQKTA